MKYNDYNSGEFRTSRGGENRYITSSNIIDDVKKSSIAILAAILVLAIVTCTVFVVFSDDFSLPAWNLDFLFGNQSTIPRDNPIVLDPDKDYPYATQTDKTPFVANAGGIGLGDFGLNSDSAILINTSDMSTVAHKNADAATHLHDLGRITETGWPTGRTARRSSACATGGRRSGRRR